MSETKTGPVSPTGPATTTPSTATRVTLSADTAAAEALAGWPERLAASVAQQRERRAAKKAFRADHQRRRNLAMPKRHAAKLEARRG